MTYEQLLTVADQNDLTVKEHPLADHDGLLRGETDSNPKRYRNTSQKILCSG